MSVLLDSSAVVAALLPTQFHPAACARRLHEDGALVYAHALNETFAVLSGGSLGFRIEAGETARLIREVAAVVDRPETLDYVTEAAAAALGIALDLV